ncbi:MAG: RagB/SusD family nutrient uptake outer membrane protein [Chitinophagales bacterium]
MKNINKYLIILLVAILFVACSKDFLEVEPKEVLSFEQATQDADALVIAAYSWLGNDHYTAPNFLWPTGNLRAGDSHKGGNGPGDIFSYHALSVYQPIIADMSTFPPDLIDLNNKKWERIFTGISRCNTALSVLNEVDPAVFPLKTVRQAEMRFLRGHFYFDLKIHHKQVPYIDENTPAEEILQVSNVALTDQELWDKIAADFRFAADNLPPSQSEVGRSNKFTAKSYLAKTLLYQAYEQDDNNAVVNINQEKLNEVVSLVDEVIASGQYGLAGDYAENFLFQFENGSESVFAIQRSIDDGSPDGRGTWSSALNYPQSAQFGCCGFHVPTDNFVNSFKTSNTGLPLFDTFNEFNYNKATDSVDPRLDHTVYMDGKPFKYDPTLIVQGDTWARAPNVYGSFGSMKELEHPDCVCRAANGPFTITSKNTVLIRYADVLLWKAEALIELGRQAEALPIINEIRQRAGNSTIRLNNASIYNIGLYDGSNWSQDFARQALRMERRLELGLEGHRFFDLVRWGIAKQWIDQYLAVERTRREYLNDASFQAGKHEYMPIPQTQINLSGGLYQQISGY